MHWDIERNLIAKRSFGVWITLLGAILMASHVSAARRSPTFEQKLQRKISVTWQGQELAIALERLTSTGQIRLWLDRRVDRGQTVTMQCVDQPLALAIEKLAQQQSLGFTRLENIVYFGPQQATLELPTLIGQARDQLTKLPTRVRKHWLRSEATTWPRLSEPRALAKSWLRESLIELTGDEQIPHDLWAEQSLPPLALVDRLVLLLAGFDLTCEITLEGCEIVPIARPLKRARRGRGNGAKNFAPQTRTQKSPRGISREGLSRQRFTLRLENQPLGKVLDQFAQQLQLVVVWDVEDTSQTRAQLVSCNVQQVDLDVLLRQVLAPAGLQHHRRGKQITIHAKP
ncbi:MAG: hypothetical protein GXP24_09220 [Planctomycetes bacterium]|nr:hypothetical protein [Planctomycetota bacterium]